jgi:hypothetical protein
LQRCLVVKTNESAGAGEAATNERCLAGLAWASDDHDARGVEGAGNDGLETPCDQATRRAARRNVDALSDRTSNSYTAECRAWTNGPVVADLWHDEKRERPRPPAQDVADEHLAVIDYVIDRYARHTGIELIRKTHLEDPWRAVSESEDSFATANPEITHDALRRWFTHDDEFLAHRSALARLASRRDIYGLDEPAMPDDLREATLRIVRQRSVG